MRADAKAQREKDSGERELGYVIARRQLKFHPVTDGRTSDKDHRQDGCLILKAFH